MSCEARIATLPASNAAKGENQTTDSNQQGKTRFIV
jgi:hypothetical protein